jgi:hypothetical protein
MWHSFLYHESSYVWNLILAHIWFTLRFALKFGCDIQTQARKGSQLMDKVCDLCRGLETGISVVLTVKSNLGILFD